MSLTLPDSLEVVDSFLNESLENMKMWGKEDLLHTLRFYMLEYWTLKLEVKGLNEYLDGNLTEKESEVYFEQLEKEIERRRTEVKLAIMEE